MDCKKLRWIIMAIFLICATVGATFLIYKSQADYEGKECRILNIQSFECHYTFITPYKNLNFYSNTTLKILINNTIQIINTYNYCIICEGCKNIYVINKEYNCLSDNNSYIITEYMYGINQVYLLIAGIVLILMVLITILVLTGIHLYFNNVLKRRSYDEVESGDEMIRTYE